MSSWALPPAEPELDITLLARITQAVQAAPAPMARPELERAIGMPRINGAPSAWLDAHISHLVITKQLRFDWRALTYRPNCRAARPTPTPEHHTA